MNQWLARSISSCGSLELMTSAFKGASLITMLRGLQIQTLHSEGSWAPKECLPTVAKGV
jgi:hypothetical protein